MNRQWWSVPPWAGGVRTIPSGATNQTPSTYPLASFVSLALITIALVCALVLNGCSQPQASKSTPQTGSPTTVFTVPIFYYDYDDVYIGSVRNALTADLASRRITYQEYDADHDQISQNAQIDKAIREGASALVVNIVNSGSAERADVICQKAKAANIPLIFFNRPIEEEDYEGVILDYYDNIAFVGTDSAEAGHLQGQMIGDYLKEHFDEVDLNGDGHISYAMFKGEAANAEAVFRTKYSVEDANAILEEAGLPDLVYFDPTSVDKFQLDLTGSWTAESATSYMTTNLVLGTPDCTTIPVFGVDATAAGRELIAAGIMTGTVSQDAEAMAACIAEMVQNVRDGKDLFHGMDEYPRDTEFGRENMIVLPYAIYSPQDDEAAED